MIGADCLPCLAQCEAFTLRLQLSASAWQKNNFIFWGQQHQYVPGWRELLLGAAASFATSATWWDTKELGLQTNNDDDNNNTTTLQSGSGLDFISNGVTKLPFSVAAFPETNREQSRGWKIKKSHIYSFRVQWQTAHVIKRGLWGLGCRASRRAVPCKPRLQRWEVVRRCRLMLWWALSAWQRMLLHVHEC